MAVVNIAKPLIGKLDFVDTLVQRIGALLAILQEITDNELYGSCRLVEQLNADMFSLPEKDAGGVFLAGKFIHLELFLQVIAGFVCMEHAFPITLKG